MVVYTRDQLTSRDARRIAKWYIGRVLSPSFRRAFKLATGGDTSDMLATTYLKVLSSDVPAGLALSTVICNSAKWGMHRAILKYKHQQQHRAFLDLRDALPTTYEEEFVEKANLCELREAISQVLATLTYRERIIIEMRYGLGDGREYTLEEVARVFHVSRGRIQQLADKAIRKLQHQTRSSRLKRFLPVKHHRNDRADNGPSSLSPTNH